MLLPAHMQSPYLLPWMNHLWTGLWVSLVYTTGLQLVLHYAAPPNLGMPGAELAFRESMTWAVLYGIFPSVLLGKSYELGAPQRPACRVVQPTRHVLA